MDKWVYLYELDSVRNSSEEIVEGQRALFETLVLKGDIVVMSFNQVADSRVFLSALEDEDSYKNMLDLARYGRIVLNRYEQVRTPAQYVLKGFEQNAKWASMPNDLTLGASGQIAGDSYNHEISQVFIHSCLPLEAISGNADIFEQLADAIKFSDPFRLRRYRDALEEEVASWKSRPKKALASPDPSKVSPEEALRQDVEVSKMRAKIKLCEALSDKTGAPPYSNESLRYLERYIQLILQMSISEISFSPPSAQTRHKPDCKPYKSFESLLDMIVSELPKEQTPHGLPSFFETVDVLRQAKKLLDSEKAIIHMRSNWDKALITIAQSCGDVGRPLKEAAQLAEAVVDLAYCCACELSVLGPNRIDGKAGHTPPYAVEDVSNKRFPVWQYPDDALGESTLPCFRDYFIDQLVRYYNPHKHTFLESDSNRVCFLSADFKGRLPDWGVAARIVGRAYDFNGDKKELFDSLAKKDLGSDKTPSWSDRIKKSSRKAFFFALAAIGVLYVFEQLTGSIEAVATGALEYAASTAYPILSSFIPIAIPLITSVLFYFGVNALNPEKRFDLPSFEQSWNVVRDSFHDRRYIARWKNSER